MSSWMLLTFAVITKQVLNTVKNVTDNTFSLVTPIIALRLESIQRNVTQSRAYDTLVLCYNHYNHGYNLRFLHGFWFCPNFSFYLSSALAALDRL